MATCHRRLPLSLAIALAAAGALPHADGAAEDGQVVIYRCTDEGGQLTLRDSPCRPGMRQQVIRMQRPQDPPPAPAQPPQSPPAAVGPPATRVVVVERPPPTYECVTPDGERYTSDDPAGHPRWVPLWTLGYPAWYSVPRPPPRVVRDRDSAHLFNGLVFDGIGRPTPEPSDSTPGGPRRPPPVGLARTPGTWVRDRCTRLPAAIVCERLRERWWQLRRGRNSALQSERERMDGEQEAIKARLAREC